MNYYEMVWICGASFLGSQCWKNVKVLRAMVTYSSPRGEIIALRIHSLFLRNDQSEFLML